MDTTDQVPVSFSKLGLNQWLVDQLHMVGIRKPTQVQANLIPEILKGRNCIGCDKTGSGKTAAFALPILQTLGEDPRAMYALVITPTRELAYQIKSHFDIFGHPLNLSCAVIIGGMDHVKQGITLTSSPHVVISTPGRLADHIRMGTNMQFNLLRFLVLDEADRLLEDGFREDLKTIYSVLPQKRQTLLFSATFTDALMEIAKNSMNKPHVWVSKSDIATVEALDERYVLVNPDMKNPYLVHVVDSYRDGNPYSLILIFVATCKYCQVLGLAFTEVGLECVTMHSEMSQKSRLDALNKFKACRIKILITTDLGSRGLDIPQVDLVVNHNVPHDPKTYIHRVGRTARAGRGGMAITLVTKLDLHPSKNLIHGIEKMTGRKLTEYEVNPHKVAKIAVEVLTAVTAALTKMDEEDFGQTREINKRKRLLLEGKDPDECNTKEKKKRKKGGQRKVSKDQILNGEHAGKESGATGEEKIQKNAAGCTDE